MRRLALAFAIVALCLGCSSSTGPGGAEDAPRRTSPGAVVQQLQDAYEAMDCELFVDCLADSFVFHLSESAVNDDDWIPESWGRAIEDSVHMRMLGNLEVAPSDSVLQISLSMAINDSVHSPGADSLSPGDDRWTIRVDALLRVWYPNNLQRIASSDQRFIIRVDPDETGCDDEPLYEILDWEDIDPWLGARDPAAPPAVEDGSWSHIKLLYSNIR